jgi:O-acetyl-ADP-ribose deacetylase (regulator of RNase III)
MIKEIKRSLLDVNVDAICHQCNVFHTMGAGLAASIKATYPEAYEADKKTKLGDFKKLGTFSKVQVTHKTHHLPLTIYNCYSQGNFGSDKTYTQYDRVEEVFNLIKQDIPKHSVLKCVSFIGIPYGYGCGLAGGDWNTVYSIIEKVFGDSDNIYVYICRLD